MFALHYIDVSGLLDVVYSSYLDEFTFWCRVLEGSKKFLHLKSCSKILNLLTTEVQAYTPLHL